MRVLDLPWPPDLALADKSSGPEERAAPQVQLHATLCEGNTLCQQLSIISLCSLVLLVFFVLSRIKAPFSQVLKNASSLRPAADSLLQI